ncbi:MAG: glycosyltransferase family 87 protein [Chloroflexota bacterium]
MTDISPAKRIGIVIAAIVAFELIGLAFVSLGVKNLGYDFEAYLRGASRILHGEPLYDVNVNVAGGFAIFLYPPPFGLAFAPFGLASRTFALWQWESLLVASLVTAIAILPVHKRIRWILLGLAVINWPVLYSILLGQVGMILLLLFAAGWRWRDRPNVLGLTMATGALIKVQPVILLAWAGATGRWRAVAVAVVTLFAAVLIATVVFGPGVWADYLALLNRVNSSVTTPNGFSVGAILYQNGVAEATARTVQTATTIAVIAVVIVSIFRSSAEVSYLTTVVASQVLSPLVWDHYAVVLILPIAWLLDRGHWWALGIMIVTSIPIVLYMPMAIYPVLFGIMLLGPLLAEAWDRRRAMNVTANPAVGST